jgi:hypothetical protein
MIEQVIVHGRAYICESFTDVHLLAIHRMLIRDQEGNFQIGDFRSQSEAAEVIKEVIIPGVSDDVIAISPRGRYIWRLDQLELPFFLLQIVRVWRFRQLTKAEAAGNQALVIEHQGSIAAIDGFMQSAPAPMREVSAVPEVSHPLDLETIATVPQEI